MTKHYEYQGQKLKQLRLAAGLSGSKLAAKLGISQASYSVWETGKREVPGLRRAKLCAVLDTTWDYVSLGKDQGLDDDWEEDSLPAALTTPQPLATEFAFQCGQMVATVDTMARQWRANPHLLDGLNPVYRDKLETIFEAVSL